MVDSAAAGVRPPLVWTTGQPLDLLVPLLSSPKGRARWAGRTRTRLPNLDSRSPFPNAQGGAAQQVSLVPWRGGAEGPRARPRPSSGPALGVTIGRSIRGRGRTGAGGARGGRPLVSLPPSRGCGPGGRAGWAALRCLHQLPHSPWATHTTRGRPPAAPGPAASGASGDRRSGRQVGVGAGQAGRRVPAVPVAVPSPPRPGGRESGGRESAQIPPLTCARTHTYPLLTAGGHAYIFTFAYNTHSHVCRCSDQNRIQSHPHTGTRTQTLRHRYIYTCAHGLHPWPHELHPRSG